MRKLLCCAAPQEEEAEAPARPARPEPVRAEPGAAEAVRAQAGRPYRDYVESEADRYWREMVKPGSLPKPDRQELRAAAFRIRGMALRRRQGKVPDPALSPYRAHQAVNAVQLHLVRIRWLKHPFTMSEECSDCAEALIQLADDTGLLGRQIPLPAHPDPQHPAIYYHLDYPASKRPVPREDALIRGDYVFDPTDGCRIIEDEYIHPWRGPDYQPSFHDLCTRGWYPHYTFSFSGSGSQGGSRDMSSDEPVITYHWIAVARGVPVLMRRRDRVRFSTPFGYRRVLLALHFSPRPLSPAELFRVRRARDQSILEMAGLP